MIMGYPQGPYGGPPQGQQQPQDPWAQPQGGGYGPPQGGYVPTAATPTAGGGYNYGDLYQNADHSAGRLLEKGDYDAVVSENTWDRTKDGTKGAWTIVFHITTGQYAGTKRTLTLSVNPVKNDGSPNPAGLGIMFRQLGAMGIPVPPAQPFWALGWSEQQVAQATIGRPVQLRIKHDEYEGVTRDKIADVKPPRPGAPTEVQRQGAPQQPQQPFSGPPQGYGQPQPQGYPQAGPQPVQGQQPYPMQGPPQGGWQPQQPPQQGPTAPMPWQPPQQPGQQAPAPGYGQTQQSPQPGVPPQGYQQPGVPDYAQPPVPGDPGAGQFTQQGQAVQPGTYQPGQPGGPGWPEPAPPQGPPAGDGAPPAPPWAQ